MSNVTHGSAPVDEQSVSGAIRSTNFGCGETAFWRVTTALLPALDFLRKIGSRAVGGLGEIEAFCVLMSLPVDIVEAQLPDGLVLYVAKTLTSTKAGFKVEVEDGRAENA